MLITKDEQLVSFLLEVRDTLLTPVFAVDLVANSTPGVFAIRCFPEVAEATDYLDPAEGDLVFGFDTRSFYRFVGPSFVPLATTDAWLHTTAVAVRVFLMQRLVRVPSYVYSLDQALDGRFLGLLSDEVVFTVNRTGTSLAVASDVLLTVDVITSGVSQRIHSGNVSFGPDVHQVPVLVTFPESVKTSGVLVSNSQIIASLP